MVFPVNPRRLLEYVPEPVPSLVWLSSVVGFCDVLQHTPLTVIDAPPVLVISPPLTAEVVVIDVTVMVVSVGTNAFVVKLSSFP